MLIPALGLMLYLYFFYLLKSLTFLMVMHLAAISCDGILKLPAESVWLFLFIAQRISLLKRGWHEGPEVVVTIGLTALG